LDDALGALVAALTEVVVSQASVRVRDVERAGQYWFPKARQTAKSLSIAIG
jgi:hypothetical protein